MSNPNSKCGQLVSASEFISAIERRDWETVDRLMGISAEEEERILREEALIDAAEVNRRLGIDDDELDAVAKSPPEEFK